MKVASLAGVLLVPVILASSPAQGRCGVLGCFVPSPVPIPPKVEQTINKGTRAVEKGVDHATREAVQAVADQAKTNFEQSLKLADAFKKGDVDKIADSAGKLIVEGECIGCKQAIMSTLGEDNLKAVEEMVGKGFVVLLNVAAAKQGGKAAKKAGALFMTHDAVAQKTIITKLGPFGKRAEQRPIPTPQEETKGSSKPDAKVAARSPRTFLPTDKATCIIASASNDSSKMSKATKSDQQSFAYIGFKDFPPLKEEASGTIRSVNEWGLRDGDKLVVEAPLCPGQNSAKNKQQSLAKVTLIYVSDYTVPRAGQVTNYVITGRLGS